MFPTKEIECNGCLASLKRALIRFDPKDLVQTVITETDSSIVNLVFLISFVYRLPLDIFPNTIQMTPEHQKTA